MRLVLSAHTAYPHFVGGREHHIHGLALGLSKNHHVEVITGGHTRVPKRTKIDGYTLVTLPMRTLRVSRVPLQIYRIPRRYYQHLSLAQPDIVHAFEYGSYTTDMAALYAARNNVPFLMTVYGYQLRSLLLRSCRMVYDRTVGRWLIRLAERVFYPSDVQRQELLRALGGAKEEQDDHQLVWQPNSFMPLPPPQPDLLAALSREHRLKGSFVLLTVARLLSRKGLDVLLGALHRLVFGGGLRDLRLLIVGPDCGSMPALRRLVEQYGLGHHVSFVGLVPHDTVSTYFHLCDLFVLPSLYEGLPLALLEAMACGKPAIFTDLDPARRVFRSGRDVILVPPGDELSLAGAISTLVADEGLRARLGLAARERAKAFTSDLEVNALEQTYETILASRASGPGPGRSC